MDPRTNRRIAEFKKPRTVDREASQEQRRAEALAEQKRKRAERIESSRNIDLFQKLSLSTAQEDTRKDDDEDDEDEDPQIAPQGLAQFASMLPSASHQPPTPMSTISAELQLPTSFTGRNKRRSGKSKKGSHRDPSLDVNVMDFDDDLRPHPLANSIMYAELLEMFPFATNQDPFCTIPADTLPSDLLTGWVVLSPVPSGKRCLAVSHQSDRSRKGKTAQSSDDGPSNTSRTLLHSRVHGKPFLTFPSPLPPDSVLDCILDSKWKENGILHVVDILRWRGKDFADCEAEFRFWWRDAKLNELPRISPIAPPPPPPAPPQTGPQTQTQTQTSASQERRFSHPAHFLPIPYTASPLTYGALLGTLIPTARSGRDVTVEMPIDVAIPDSKKFAKKKSKGKGKGKKKVADKTGEMEVEAAPPMISPLEQNNAPPAIPSQTFQPASTSKDSGQPPAGDNKATFHIPSDGLLLYVSQASYQPGDTPLACWVPLSHPAPPPGSDNALTPIGTFESLVKKRYEAAVANSNTTSSA